MTRKALAACAAGAVFVFQFYSFALSCLLKSAAVKDILLIIVVADLRRSGSEFPSRWTARHVWFLVFHHVPNDRSQPTHYRHACNL